MSPSIPEVTRRGLEVPPDILAMDPERMRELGYWVVDRVVAHLIGLREQPAISVQGPQALHAALGGPVPDAPHPIEDDLRALADIALANEQHGDHPRYFARVASPSSYPAILGDWLGTGMLSVASSWAGGSGPTAVELIVTDWLRDALGLPATSEAVLLSGGSMANTTAFIVARHERGPGVVYCTDQTHSSLPRGLRSIGVAPEDIRMIPTDAQYRMPAAGLAAAIAADIAAGRAPRMVIATAGTTNTGAVDDLPAIAGVCRSHDLWLHVDGAYGAPAALTDRAPIAGLELVDSFVTDPHKWLFQPYGIACLFVRSPGALERTFAMHPEYLADLMGEQPDLHNRSLELSRPSRALRLWLTLRAYGLPVIARAVERGIALAEYAQAVIEADPAFEIVTPAQIGILTFAARGADDAAHREAAAELTDSGYAAVSTTVLRGRTVLRLCIINPATTTADLDGTIERLRALLTA